MQREELSWMREVRAWWRDEMKNPAPLTLIDVAMCGLYELDGSGITISTDQAGGISCFSGLTPAQYLQLCALLGLTQWRALDLNDMLVVEDFNHAEPNDCLFARRSCKSDYTLALERPNVCFGCFEFYHSLGADLEIVAVAELLQSLRKLRLVV